MKNTQRPVKTEKTNSPIDGERYEHPAFGMMSVSVVTCGEKVELFGSDVSHGQVIRIRIYEASYDRGLSSDWHHAGRLLLELDMSHAQFAHFIMSQNKGDGVPVTLRMKPADPRLEDVPYIQSIESKIDTFKTELEKNTSKQLEKIVEQINIIGQMIESGKTISKRELQAVHRELKILVGNAPSNMSFVVKQAEKAIEHMVHEAREEYEAMAENVVRKVGVDAIKMGFLLADQSSEDKGD